MNIGILGGSFDPVHTGHLIVAECAREQLGLARVLFLPAARNPLKPDRQPSADLHRLAMLDLATSHMPAFEIHTADLDRPAPSYTVDSLEILRAEFGAETQLHFIMGTDSLDQLPRWREPERILEMARLAVFQRPGPAREGDASLEDLEAQLPALADRLDWIDGPEIGISATRIRRWRREGRSIRFQVPAVVESYIFENGLYAPEPDATNGELGSAPSEESA